MFVMILTSFIPSMLRERFGKYIYNPFSFEGRFDALTSATITSASEEEVPVGKIFLGVPLAMPPSYRITPN
jgi:hypothetical protein